MSICYQLQPIRQELKEIETLILDTILGSNKKKEIKHVKFPEEIQDKINKWYQEKIIDLFPEKDIKDIIFYRISLGEKVAKIKFEQQKDLYLTAVNDMDKLMKLITHPDIEEKILERVTNYIINKGGTPETAIKVKKMYEEIINITKNYQVYFINIWLS